MRKLLLTLVSALFIASPALASTVLQARLETPVDQKERLIADEKLWICEQDLCITHLRTASVTIKTCQKLVVEIGQVKSYGDASHFLDEDQLRTCNESSEY